MLHPCVVSLTSLLKRAFSFPFLYRPELEKNLSVVDAARPPHNNVSEKVLAVHNSLHYDAVITLPIHVVSMINYWSNNRNVCTIYCTCAHRKLPLILVDSHDLLHFFSFWNTLTVRNYKQRMRKKNLQQKTS